MTKSAYAGVQGGEVTAEAAAGVFFEERRGLLGSLHRLLQVHQNFNLELK